MTQEQNKPVRIRDEQAEEIFSAFKGVTHTDGSQFLPHLGRQDLLNALAEAEARGAAEQRRKDAEGMKEICPDCDGSGEGVADTICCTCNGSGVVNSANVAAMEARIAELKDQERKDAQVIHWLAEKLKHAHPEAKADYEHMARAALTREGGE